VTSPGSSTLLEQALFAVEGGSPFADELLLRAMLRFEGALAQSQEALKLIPPGTAAVIARVADALVLDPAEMARSGGHTGALAIPVVRALTQAVGAADPAAARYVHFGATSQDVLDSSLSLCAKDALARIDDAAREAVAAGLKISERHAGTPALARTLMQPAGITTLGCRAAQWAWGLAEARAAFARSGVDATAVSLGGPIGTLSVGGDSGDGLQAEVSARLGLTPGTSPWHVVRNARVRCAADAAILVGVAAKIGTDVSLGAQFEVGEYAEPAAAGRGGSSAMPHKRNPALSLRLIAAGHRCVGLMATVFGAQTNEFERGLGGWQTETATWPAVLETALSAMQTCATLLGGMELHADRAQANIDALQGVLSADRVADWLAPSLGKLEAQSHVAEWCGEALRLREPLGSVVLRHLWELPQTVAPEGLAACFDTRPPVEAAEAMTHRLIASVRGTL